MRNTRIVSNYQNVSIDQYISSILKFYKLTEAAEVVINISNVSPTSVNNIDVGKVTL